MNNYIDIELFPDEEIPIHFIRNKVFSKLHKALFDLQCINIGVSFPKYTNNLGELIRLHGTPINLTKLQQTNWIGRLTGYCEVSDIMTVPSDVKHRVISRKQANMTAAKLRRLIKRGTISADQAKQYKAKMFTQGLDNPYLELESSSNGHKHRRYIQFGELLDKPISGEFDAFGLSKTATIPWF